MNVQQPLTLNILMTHQAFKKDLDPIFLAGVSRVDPYRLVKSSVKILEENLTVDAGQQQLNFNLSAFNRIMVIGFGKATAKMALAMEEILGDRLSEGVISVKYGHTEPLRWIVTVEAGHPIPDENGLKAARKMTDLVSKADEKTLVITLISGGGSALIPYPLCVSTDSGDISLTMAEKQVVTRTLLECGATIHEINTVRKHLSLIKGGRLAELITPATSLSLILSDVVGDNLDVIASGATSPDASTFADVQAVFDRYSLIEQLPDNVRQMLHLGLQGRIPETPKPGDKIFHQVHNVLIGTNRTALEAAKKEAEKRGYQAEIVTSQLIGEAREVARDLFKTAIQKQPLPDQKPLCLLFGGETTVTIRGNGKGGRNQEMSLAFLSEMGRDPTAARRITFLSAGTDGNDGPTDAAGAYADMELVNLAAAEGLSITDYLENNDAYHFFDAIDGLMKTGPTNTNVCDIQLILIF
jgi:glycerate 2-kinase